MTFARLTGACVALGLVVQERKLEAWQKVRTLVRRGDVVVGCGPYPFTADRDMYLGDLGTISTAYAVPWRYDTKKAADDA